jgi:hypothetical protein
MHGDETSVKGTSLNIVWLIIEPSRLTVNSWPISSIIDTTQEAGRCVMVAIGQIS